MSQKYNQTHERLAHVSRNHLKMQKLGFHGLHLSMTHLSVQNTVKSAQRAIATLGRRVVSAGRESRSPASIPSHLSLLCGSLTSTTRGEASPPVVMDPLQTQRRKFSLERQGKEMGRTKGSKTLAAPYCSLPGVQHLRLGGQ